MEREAKFAEEIGITTDRHCVEVALFHALRASNPSGYVSGEPVEPLWQGRTTIDGEFNLNVVAHRLLKLLRLP